MKLRHLFLKIFMAIIFAGSLILIYYYFLDGTLVNPVANERDGRIYLTTQKSYTVGDDVIVYSSNFCKYRPVDTTVYWFLQDDVQLPYPPKSSKFSARCYDKTKIEVEVLPGYVGNHTYKFVGKIIYHTLVRDITVDVETNDFYVNSKK